MNFSKQLLDNLPHSTPPWAIALISIILSGTVSLVIFYTTVRGEVKDYISGKFSTEVQEVRANSDVLSSILALAKDNSSQITSLSGSLVIAQQKNLELENRVSTIENELKDAKSGLELCQEKLKGCIFK